jgi:hypothetical protein
MDDRFIFIAADMKGYSGTLPSEHAELQSALRTMLDDAGRDAGLPVDRWDIQPQGDGVLIMAPPDREPRYVDDFITHLLTAVHRYNRRLDPLARVRIRVALDQGPADVGANGYTGDVPILACRLRDADITKSALADSDAVLVLVLSDVVCRDNVANERSRFTLVNFTRVDIEEEKVSAVGWVWLPDGQDSPSLRAAREARNQRPAKAAEPAEPKAQVPTQVFEFHEQVVADVIGTKIVGS